MISEFYTNFFDSQYKNACRLFSILQEHNPLDINHYNLAVVLGKVGFTSDDVLEVEIHPLILELEALRLESGFVYDQAMELRQAICKCKNSLLNQLSLINIKLKFKPINECDLNFFDTLSSEESEQIRYSSLHHNRILSILEFISDNAAHTVLPQSLADLSKFIFEKQHTDQPSLVSTQNLVKAYFCLQEYEAALKILREVNSTFGMNEILSDYLVRTNIRLGNYHEAFNFVQRYIRNNPYSVRLSNRYGMILRDLGKTDESYSYFNHAFSELLLYVKARINLANSYRRLYSYRISTRLYLQVIFLIPVYNQLCFNIAVLLNDLEDINSLCKQAVTSIPNSCYGLLAMSYLSSKLGESEIDSLKYAWERLSYSWYIAERIIVLVKSNDLTSKEEGNNLRLKEEICLQFINSGNKEYKLICLIHLAYIYLYHGFLIELYQILDTFQEALLGTGSYHIDSRQAIIIYTGLCFIVPTVRDSVLFNNLIFCTIAEKSKNMFANWKKLVAELYDIDLASRKQIKSKPLRIGFMSPNFHGHVVGLLSIDVIREMSLIPELEVVMIATDVKCKSANFLKTAKEIPSLQVIELYEKLCSNLASIFNLNLDVLIDLDGTTSPYFLVLYSSPAVVNCSWLGFDAPYISDKNYFLCDSYTHPEEVDEFYIEKLVRLPHSHMCVEGFKVSDKDINLARNELVINDDQIVFIYPSGVRKFNFNTAIAHVKILSRVPNSVMLIKEYSGTPKLLEIWKEECVNMGVDFSRIKSVPTIPDVEQHRLLLKLSDIYLDAYPYNGGSISLEALWCELPIVTYCGEQSFARMGYSLLSTAGITEGIAYSWEEYIEWAVRLANDRDLRLSIKERLAKGKDPDNLCPLWNPKQFARDMYDILQDLYQKAVTEED